MSLGQCLILAYFKRLLKIFRMLYNNSRKIDLPLSWESLGLLLEFHMGCILLKLQPSQKIYIILFLYSAQAK